MQLTSGSCQAAHRARLARLLLHHKAATTALLLLLLLLLLMQACCKHLLHAGGCALTDTLQPGQVSSLSLSTGPVVDAAGMGSCARTEQRAAAAARMQAASC